MAAKMFLLLGCVALGSAALVRRDAGGAGGAGAAGGNLLDEWQKQAADFQKTFTEQLNAITGSKDSQSFQKALFDGSESVLAQLSAYSASLQSALGDASGKTKEALESMRTNLEKTAADLRKAHPEVEEQATALKDKIQVAVQNTLQESQKLAKEVAANVEQTNQKLAPKLKEAYDEFIKHAQDAQTKIAEAAGKH